VKKLRAFPAASVAAAGITGGQPRTAVPGYVHLAYGKNYAGRRYVSMEEITRTAAGIAPKWIFRHGVPGKFETTPLVFGGLMSLTGPSNHS
jgi:glucose dehydrogenase